MSAVALGMPGQFAAWAFEAIRLLRAGDPAAETRWIDRFDSYEHDAVASALIASQFPSRSLRDALLRERMPIVLFVTPAVEAVCHQMQYHRVSLLEAVRTVSASVALLSDCVSRSPALVLDSSARQESARLLRAAALHLGIPLPDGLLDGVLAAMPPLPLAQETTGMSESEEAIVTLVLENAVAHLRDPRVPQKCIWPHRVFFFGDKPNEQAPLVADATGSSRVLYYGPYLHLSEGRWRAKLTLGFTKEAVGLPLKVSALGPGLLGEARMRPRQEGIFAAQFSFAVGEPEHPVEFHVRTEEGAIEGRIALGQVELDRIEGD